MTTTNQLVEALSKAPADSDVVISFDGSELATILIRDRDTGLLSSTVDAPLEALQVHHFDESQFAIPTISDGQGRVEGVPIRASVVIGIEVAGQRVNGQQIIPIGDEIPAAEQLRFAIRGIADQAAKRAGELVDDIPVATVTIETER